MDVKAESRLVRVSPRKVRLVADSIRTLSAGKAVEKLSLSEKRGAVPLLKTLKSAMANAVNNAKLDSNGLFVKQVEVMEGPRLKRFHPSTRGRIHPYKRGSSHIRIVLEERKG